MNGHPEGATVFETVRLTVGGTLQNGGCGEIRTHGTIYGSLVFRTSGINRSPTHPWRKEQDSNLHTPFDVSPLSKRVRYQFRSSFLKLAERVGFELTTPFGVPR